MGNRGISLVITIVFILILSVLGIAFLSRNYNQSQMALRYANSTKAFWLAEAGIQKANWEKFTNNCTSFVTFGTSTAACPGNCSGCSSGIVSLAGTLTSMGNYDVNWDVTNGFFTSVGSSPGRSASNVIKRKVKVYISSSSVFNGAIFAKGQVYLHNNAETDSYDSRLGAWNVNGNIGQEGHIGSNGTGANIVRLGNHVEVYGNVSTGAGGTVKYDDSATKSGTETNANNVSLPSVVVPSELTSLASEGVVTRPNNSPPYYIYAGDHKFTSFDLNNHSSIVISGGNVRLYLTDPTTALRLGNNGELVIAPGASLTIYTEGKLDINNNGGINNAGQDPTKLSIYSKFTGVNGIDIANNGDLYGGVYAPDTDVRIRNNGNVFGALIGSTVDISNNANIHYDKALGPGGPGNGTSNYTNWQEY